MTRNLTHRLRRFLRDDHGSAHTIEFVLWVPLFLLLIIAKVEMGAMSMRHTQLERSLDATVRDVRLGTGTTVTHADLKASICARAPLLGQCEENLKLEMITLDLRDWNAPPSTADCVDTAQAVNPLRSFVAGTENELMYLRACYRYAPIAPNGMMAQTLFADEDGLTQLVSFSAFVQEPSS